MLARDLQSYFDVTVTGVGFEIHLVSRFTGARFLDNGVHTPAFAGNPEVFLSCLALLDVDLGLGVGGVQLVLYAFTHSLS